MIPKRFRTISLVVMVVLLLVSTTVLAAPYGSRPLHSGTFGGDVVELQRRLTSLGYDTGSTDGIFGSRTREAVMRFQRDYGLVPDGMADKWTFRAVDRSFTWKNGSFYTVVPGDTLWQIAEKAGTDVAKISWLNQLQDHWIYPGQNLRLDVKLESSAPDPAPVPPPVVAKPERGPIPADVPPPQPADEPTPEPVEPTEPTEPATGTPQTPVPDGSALPDQPARSTNGIMVLGYYAEDWVGDRGSLKSLQNSMNQVDLVVNFNLLIDAQGKITTRDYPELAAEAKKQGIQVQGLVHNFHNGTFDANVARAVLSNPEVRARAITNMIAVAQEQGLSGINIDIENVPPDQRHNYTALIREMQEKLKPLGLDVTLSIPAKTFDDTKSAWSGAFDYKALGQYADKVMVMSYDEHTIGYKEGPVASVGWVDKVAAFAASQMDPDKVLLGIAAYGYDWQKGTTQGRGRSIPQVMDLALKHGATMKWDDVAKVPYFTYVNNGQERIVYFENAQSTGHKLELVKKHGLGGIGIWRLGLEDPGIWSVIAEKLR